MNPGIGAIGGDRGRLAAYEGMVVWFAHCVFTPFLADWILMTLTGSTLHRRAFLAAGVVSIPSAALARGVTADQAAVGGGSGMEFGELMGEAGRHLKSMRGNMRDLESPGARDDAAFLANQVTILLAQCVMVADQESIPKQSEAKYDGDTERFTKDLQVKLTHALSMSVELCRALLLGDDDRAVDFYGKLRQERKEGHDEFIEEED